MTDNFIYIAIAILCVIVCVKCILFLCYYRKSYNDTRNENLNLDNEVRDLRSSLNKSEKKKENLEVAIAELEQKIKDFSNLLTSRQAKIVELENADADKKRIIDDKQEHISVLETEIKNKTIELKNSLQKIEKLNSENTDKDKVIKRNEERILELEQDNETDELLDQIDLLKRRNKELENKNDKLKKETDDLKGKLTNKETTIKIKDDRINELEKKIGVEPIIVKETLVNPTPTLTISSERADDIDKTKRTIDIVIDVETNKEISAKEFFSQPETTIFKMRTELQRAIYLRHPKFICKYCGQMVKISGRKNERGAATFFSHLRDSNDCDYKTTTGRTKKEIECEKYSKCNEGKRHRDLKEQIATFLNQTSGVTNVRTENTMPGNHPILNWRRPDVAVSYRGQEIIFELQLSSTFVSVITERDLFYRLNKKFIIWVFNFDEQSEHVNLSNMLIKDVYYNHKLNVFIFDKSAYNESKKRGELILKCNWIKPDGSWEYQNNNNSDDLGGRFVSLSELTYGNDYKPYYYDAEKDYFAQHPTFEKEIISIEEDNKKILNDLDKRLQEKEEALHDFNKQLAELKDAFEIDSEIKHTQRYLIGRQNGKVGLITVEGDIKIPFEFDSIEARRNWIEAKRDNSVILYDKKNYEMINKGIKYESIGENIFRIAQREGEDILWGLMGKRGENIVETKFSQIELWNAEKQLLLVVKNGKYGIMNQHGSYVLKNKYDFIEHLDNNGYANIKFEGKAGRINSDCHFIKETSISIGNSYTKICLMGKWGIENTDTKKLILDCKYDELGSYRGTLLGIKEASMKLFDVSFLDDCPVKVKLVGKNDRGMLIYKVGSKEALMNIRQQQKARKANVNPKEATEMYISFVNLERDLIYLSATPIKESIPKKDNDSDITLGTIVEGPIIRADKNHIIIKSENEPTAYVHHSTWGDYSATEFHQGEVVSIEKIGFDDKHKKHIWKIKSILHT